jgi:hypothetical protein
MQLVRAYALLAGTDKKHCLKPDMQLDVTGFEDGPDLDGERLAALIALVGAYTSAFALQLVHAILTRATVGANRTIGPDMAFHEFVGRFFVMEMCLVQYRHRSSPIDVDTVPNDIGYVKYNIAKKRPRRSVAFSIGRKRPRRVYDASR